MYFVHQHFKNLLSLLGAIFSNPKNGIFLEKVKSMYPEKSVVLTNSGRCSLCLIIETLKLQNQEIAMPAYICNIYNDIITKYNLKPILIDVLPNQFIIEKENIAKNISINTKAVIYSHTYGQRQDLLPLKNFLTEKNIYLIEDCAHLFGAIADHHYVGQLADCAFFSLPKIMPIANGGVALLPLKNTIEAVKYQPKANLWFDMVYWLKLAPFGLYLARHGTGSAKNNNIPLKLNPLGKLSQKMADIWIANFPINILTRQNMGAQLENKLKQIGFLAPVSQEKFYTYVSVLFPENKKTARAEFIKLMASYKIYCTTMWHDPLGLNDENCPNTQDISTRIINFPLQNFYKQSDIDYIAKCAKESLSKIN